MTATDELPSAGRFEAGVHILPLRIYWEDTDGSGVVYYANYLRFIERARSDLLRQIGINQRSLLERDGTMFAVRKCTIDYLSPARLDDRIEVRSRMDAVRGASLDAVQVVRRDDLELARARVRIACLNRDGRPRRLPPAVRASLAGLMAPAANAHPTETDSQIRM
jgi:acyl-CoA thioester hydrolase